METTSARVVRMTEARVRGGAGTLVAPPAWDDLHIDGWLVQPALNMLTRDEVSVRLRSQLMDLLMCLASRPGKVFGKEELVAAVWDGRWIAPSALSRCVAELRAALGDDAHRPRVIETITKRGYRLIAPVAPASEPKPRPAPAGEPTACPRPPACGPLSWWHRFERAARLLAWRTPARA